MSSSKKLATAALAGLLTATIMGAGIAQAAEHETTTIEKTTSSTTEKEKHACKGLNSCKGQGADGKNDCKGKGNCATDK